VSVPRGVATVLLCDDDDDVRCFLSELLKSNGYMVREASGAGAAFRILEECVAVELSIVDYAMPGINGLEIIRQAGHRRPGLKTLLITGDAGAPCVTPRSASHCCGSPLGPPNSRK
jgi:DNA-binding NtrC family response regulator